MALRVGSGLPNIQRERLANYLVVYPEMEEQRAIAAVLSEMDAEIAALERQRAKVTAIKQGMMQELLTGRIRLVKPKPLDVWEDSVLSKHRTDFDDAITLAELVYVFSDASHPLGRMRYNKAAYLFYRYVGESVDDFLPKAAGPYSPKFRYGRVEDIAKARGYVQYKKVGSYKGFVRGKKIDEAPDTLR